MTPLLTLPVCSTLETVFFIISHLLSSPFCFSLPPSRNSDPRPLSRIFSRHPHNGFCLAFLSREDSSSLFPRQLALNCAYPRYRRPQQLIPFFAIKSKSYHGGIRTHGSTLYIFNSSIQTTGATGIQSSERVLTYPERPAS